MARKLTKAEIEKFATRIVEDNENNRLGRLSDKELRRRIHHRDRVWETLSTKDRETINRRVGAMRRALWWRTGR